MLLMLNLCVVIIDIVILKIIIIILLEILTVIIVVVAVIIHASMLHHVRLLLRNLRDKWSCCGSWRLFTMINDHGRRVVNV